ncbi:hypothetical protein F1643_19330 [Azospirillum sp. INR13]|uniref:hypothetical protein n=1 Tax=Azospirillum sp. INR13 TaxID=2596919 RepID=UPI0018920DB9|nr:hypothetical protein [Azospirillum sp. INR13]MBF5096202.1 hypothetical protein [Azospirillum sp. INR13]
MTVWAGAGSNTGRAWGTDVPGIVVEYPEHHFQEDHDAFKRWHWRCPATGFRSFAHDGEARLPALQKRSAFGNA